ncbi:hypothetical protein EW026_g2149 [Hermanssonia centrifuga]|uniref:Galactose oxidase n=1 Tax=Hermanssonia centrifuga TaxID=98765 RepID=A0A4V3XB31_9APHY|nr:hypothetical protein EW026_g2149 [Hermanssonia centrifuga]
MSPVATIRALFILSLVQEFAYAQNSEIPRGKEHYLFDPSGPTFSQLPASNGPPDITGHQSIPLPDGRLLILGGYQPSKQSMIPFSTIWTLDTTQTSLSWSTASVSVSNLPTPRRGFAATLLDGGKVLIHGGTNGVMQSSYDDGWVLDTTQSPMTWTSISQLTSLGPRRDHFALGLGSMVIFGFGYAENGGASAALEVFDVTSGTFVTSYTPPAAVTSPTATTLPLPSQTNSGLNPSSTGPPSYGSAEIPYPSGRPGQGGGGGGNGNGQNGQGNGSGNGSSASGGTAWYVRRRQSSQESFHHLLDESDDGGSPRLGPILPVAGAVGYREKGLPLPPVERRDMLAEEDTRHFDEDWYRVRRDPSSGQSSWTTSRQRPALEKVYDSLVSLRSAGGAMLDYATGAAVAGARSLKSKDASTGSRSTAWQEKDGAYDPFGDDLGLIRYGPPSLAGRRQTSSHTYTDPFEDYEVESLELDPDVLYRDEPEDPHEPPWLLDPPPRPNSKLQTLLPRATLDLSRLTPVSEQPSFGTMTDPSSNSDSSHGAIPNTFVISQANSSSSSQEPQSPRRPSSILDVNTPSTPPMRRSNSWWTRFARTPLLDRRSSDSSRAQRPLDFRDPNPPPRLVPIEESTHSNSPDSPKRKTGSSGSHYKIYSSHQHGRSASSLQTARTANSENLDRLGQTMQIVQKGSTMRSNHSADPSLTSTNSTREYSPERREASPPQAQSSAGGKPLSIVASSLSGDSAEMLVMSPGEITTEEYSKKRASPPPQHPKRPLPPERTSSGSIVAARIQAYERRMSQQEEPLKSPPPVPVRARNRATSTYGLAPKPSLFVANPDRKRSSG